MVLALGQLLPGQVGQKVTRWSSCPEQKRGRFSPFSCWSHAMPFSPLLRRLSGTCEAPSPSSEGWFAPRRLRGHNPGIARLVPSRAWGGSGPGPFTPLSRDPPPAPPLLLRTLCPPGHLMMQDDHAPAAGRLAPWTPLCCAAHHVTGHDCAAQQALDPGLGVSTTQKPVPVPPPPPPRRAGNCGTHHDPWVVAPHGHVLCPGVGREAEGQDEGGHHQQRPHKPQGCLLSSGKPFWGWGTDRTR